MHARSPWPLVFPLLLLLAAPLGAGPPLRPPQDPPPESHPPREELTLDEAVALARQRARGRVLSARRQKGEYRVRILTPQGRVKRFRMDRRGRFR